MGQYLSSLFLNDLLIEEPQTTSLIRYADSSVIIPVCKGARDESEKVLDSCLRWTVINNMKCNTGKCKKVCFVNRGFSWAFPSVHGVEWQVKERAVLGLTLQNNCKYSIHVKIKLYEAMKCLLVITTLRKESYSHVELDKLFYSPITTSFLS